MNENYTIQFKDFNTFILVFLELLLFWYYLLIVIKRNTYK